MSIWLAAGLYLWGVFTGFMLRGLFEMNDD